MNPIYFMAVVFLLASIFIAAAGYLIREKKQLWMIAGYDPNRVKDKDGLARLVGTGLLIMGGLDIVASLLILALPGIMPLQILVFVAINIFGVVVLLLNAQKFAG